MRCTYCGSNNHTIENCPMTWGGQFNRNNMNCTYCGSNKHKVNACPKTFTGSAKRAWHQKSIEDDYIND